jgi:hypothetical protein
MAKSRKSAREAEETDFKQVFVVLRGEYAGRIMTMKASHADAALADGWGVETSTAFPPNDTPLFFEGDVPQSYLDWVDDFATPGEPDPPPEPPAAPTISALTPNTAVSGAVDDITMVVTGTGFTAGSVIVFNGFDEPTTLISDTECSTGVRPSIFGVAVCPVEVRDAGGTSNSLDFTFTEPEAPVTSRRR